MASTPVLTPSSGTYSSDQNLTITDSTPGTTFYYTSATGSIPPDPTTASTPSSGSIPVSGNGTVTIKAIAAGVDLINSAIVTATYKINYPTASTPTLSPAAGTYPTHQSIVLTDSTPTAAIYYTSTTDGSIPTDPTTASTHYTAPIPVSGNGAKMNIKAIAAGAELIKSAIVTGAYTITYATASTPAASPAPGPYSSNQSVVLTDSTPGTAIYYTSATGSIPANPTTASTLYSGSIPVSGNGTVTIKAIAAGSELINSAILTAAYTITYTVTYNANGDHPGNPPSDLTKYLTGAMVTVLGNTHNLKNFKWWNTASNGTGTTYYGGNTFSMGTANVTLYDIH
jgi:hypothetical protein